MANPLILYSTNTWLAYHINKRYYRDEHFVWCSPYFDFAASPSFERSSPPSAIPSVIYRRLLEDTSGGDEHSDAIRGNRRGVRKGAAARKRAGRISEGQEFEILDIVRRARVADFKPLLYVIPYGRVARLIRDVPPGDRAHPLSWEYRIESLPRRLFDVLELRLVL